MGKGKGKKKGGGGGGGDEGGAQPPPQQAQPRPGPSSAPSGESAPRPAAQGSLPAQQGSRPQQSGARQVEMNIPGQKVGLIIGKGGETIKKLMDEFGVKMLVDQQDRSASAGFKPLRITGDPKNVAEAQKRVMQIIGDEAPKGQQQAQSRPGQQAGPGYQGPASQPASSSWGQRVPQQTAPPREVQPDTRPPQAQPQPSQPRGQPQQPAPGPWGPPPQTAEPRPPQSQQRGQPKKSAPPGFPQAGSDSSASSPSSDAPSQQSRQHGQAPKQGPQGVPTQGLGSSKSSVSSDSPSTASAKSIVSKASVGDVTQGLESLSLRRKPSEYPVLSHLIPPKRADRQQDPKQGRKFVVETNHLPLSVSNPKMTIYHYDVAIVPDKPFRFYRPALREVQKILYPQNYPSFDGKKNLYSARKLPLRGDSATETVTILDPERNQPKEVTVTITIAAEVSLASVGEYLRGGTSTRPPQDAIQALDVALRQPAANSPHFIQVGRSFFTEPKERIIELGDGLNLWYGFFQSAILGWRPYLNIDVAHKGFPAAVNCIEALSKFTRGEVRPNDRIDDRDIRSLGNLVKGLKVIYTVPPDRQQRRTYKVLGIGRLPGDHKFKVQDRGEMSVTQYYRETYNYIIRFQNVPCLQCGSVQNPIALPPELCTIMTGQIVLKKLNENQTRVMVKEAATPAPHRRQKILDAMTRVRFNQDPHVAEFGLKVEEKFKQVEARVLNAPSIEYGNRTVNVNKGVWNSEPFIRAGRLDNWGIYNCERRVREQELKTLERELQNIGRSLGMTLGDAQIKHLQSDNPRQLQADFTQFQKQKLQLLFVILPNFGQITYAKIKHTAEINVGLLTQCLKSRTIGKLSPATVTNILLKVNAKVNGINHYISPRSFGTGWPRFLQRPVMVVGADVTHPSPDQQDIPSVAAVAASHDARAFHYNMKWRLQQPREEMIQDLENIMIEQLRFFERTTKHKPEHILFYRDGVSEGQFRKVLEIELTAIRNACKKVQPDGYEPPITFLVVQKRHHTRFFPTNKRDADGRNENVPAGTIVDTEVVHRNEFDFYLVSHASIQGTSRPTKYHVLWDDAAMSEQVLEEITYYLCHLFTRCTRAVSYPAPTYYAHLAAFRVRSYIENAKVALHNLEKEQTSRRVQDDIMNGSPMFFV